MTASHSPASLWRGRGLLLALPLFLILSLTGRAETLNLVSDIWPPFTNHSDQPRFAIVLVLNALQRAGFEGKPVIVEDWQGAIDQIAMGKYEGSAALWFTEEREQFLQFSNPYLENRLVLVGPSGANVNTSRFEELAGKRIAIVGSYAYGDEVQAASDVDWVTGKNDQDNLEKLLKGEVDYMLADELLMQVVLENQSEEANRYLAVGTTPLLTRKLYFALNKSVTNADGIIEGFNQAIQSMIADGTYNRILQLSWIRADVDGDGRLELVAAGDRMGGFAPSRAYSIPMPASAKQSSGVERYWIGGRLYESWEDVPDDHKEDRYVTRASTGVGLLEFRF